MIFVEKMNQFIAFLKNVSNSCIFGDYSGFLLFKLPFKSAYCQNVLVSFDLTLSFHFSASEFIMSRVIFFPAMM